MKTNTHTISSIIEEVLSASTDQESHASEQKLTNLIEEGQLLEEQLIRIFQTIKEKGIRGNAQGIAQIISKIKSGELARSTRKAEQIILGASIIGAKKAKEGLQTLHTGLKHAYHEFKEGWKEGSK